MNELAKQQSCIVMRNGMHIWIDKDKAEHLHKALNSITESKFINFDGKTLNTADITGLFTAQDIDEFSRIKRGEWQDKKGEWHAKNEIVPDMEASRKELDRIKRNHPPINGLV